MKGNRLEELCRPIVSKLCVYWQMANAGEELDAEIVEYNLKSLLTSIKDQISEDPSLKKGFSKIERPLVFFIDYTIREGHFPFSHDWHELSYDYNELSGDEKFFDLLTESLDDPDTSHGVVDSRIDHHWLLPWRRSGDLLIHVEKIAISLCNSLMSKSLDSFREVKEYCETCLVHTITCVAALLCST